MWRGVKGAGVRGAPRNLPPPPPPQRSAAAHQRTNVAARINCGTQRLAWPWSPLAGLAWPLPRSADPALEAELGEPLAEAMRFFKHAEQAYGPLLHGALSAATG